MAGILSHHPGGQHLAAHIVTALGWLGSRACFLFDSFLITAHHYPHKGGGGVAQGYWRESSTSSRAD